MTKTEGSAAFEIAANYEDLTPQAVDQFKISILDSMGYTLARARTVYNALSVTRTGKLSHWKVLAYPNMAAGSV